MEPPRKRCMTEMSEKLTFFLMYTFYTRARTAIFCLLGTAIFCLLGTAIFSSWGLLFCSFCKTQRGNYIGVGCVCMPLQLKVNYTKLCNLLIISLLYGICTPYFFSTLDVRRKPGYTICIAFFRSTSSKKTKKDESI